MRAFLSSAATPADTRSLLRLIACVTAAVVVASVPLAGEVLAIVGGTVHPVSTAPFIGTVVLEDGRISAAASDAEAPPGTARIDATGLHVYPGIIDPVSQLGMIEIGAVSATNDRAEMGGYNPHLSALTAVHPASELIPVARSNGVTHAVIAPQGRTQGDGGVLVGRAGLVHLDGWTVEEMAVEASIAMVIDWPAIRTRRFDFSTFTLKETPYNDAKDEADGKRSELVDWLEAARHYGQARSAGSARLVPERRLAALASALEEEQLFLVRAQAKRDIEGAVEFAEEHGLEIAIVGGRDAWEVSDLLVEHEVPVLLGFVQSLPRDDDDPYDRPLRTAAVLVEAGVRIGFASGAGGGFGPGGAHAARTLPYEAGSATGYGLDPDDAVRALTLWPAEILGIDDRFGSIEPGKVANLMITDGDPLEITTEVRHVVIRGREVSTDNRHRRLYERYRVR